MRSRRRKKKKREPKDMLIIERKPRIITRCIASLNFVLPLTVVVVVVVLSSG